MKVNELVETGTENLFTKPNHPDLGEENNKHHLTVKLENVTVVDVKTIHSAPLKRYTFH